MNICSSPLLGRQILIFAVGWLAYASAYFLRKPIGVVKTDLESELSFTKSQLGLLDTALLLPYAVMQILLGPVGDKFGPRKTFGICLLFAAVSMASFGHWSNLYVFLFLLFFNGTAQALCWPSCMKIIGEWYPDKIRNTIFGTFGTCAFAGGVLGTGIAVYLQTTHGWRSAFLTPSIFVGGMGFLILMFFHQPSEVGIEVPGKDQSNSRKSSGQQLSLLQLWKIPMLPEIAIAVFCLKAVRYCMYMWLPMYLLNQLKYSKVQAGMFSTTFEIGGVIGSAAIGIVLDKLYAGRPLVGTCFSCFLSSVALILFLITGSWGMTFNSVLLFLAGGFNCGPDSILGGSVPAELGEMEGRNAAAATVGLVNGFGSVGTFLEGPIVGIISTVFGWTGMFYFMIGLSLLGTFSVFRASIIKARRERQIPDPVALNEELL
ncbi:hypothetical protein CHS0354_038533 [Potamilus streckersoni]|uniref:Major facilitator superfamily (MFS) profile domain-containing protein n=1 Tax=Potamilus streckersoni TaxID=2493646 RepID=A0AAE0S6B0_9BIVA|nr:hypothetical protein CHS0354_038533 [Potamilus streckersoni]